MNKWYMHNTESVQESETNKILREFEIQTDHRISAGRPDIAIVKKQTKKTQTNKKKPANGGLRMTTG